MVLQWGPLDDAVAGRKFRLSMRRTGDTWKVDEVERQRKPFEPGQCRTGHEPGRQHEQVSSLFGQTKGLATVRGLFRVFVSLWRTPQVSACAKCLYETLELRPLARDQEMGCGVIESGTLQLADG